MASSGCDRAAQTKIIEEHITDNTMKQVDGQWKRWCEYVACQPREVFMAGTSLDQSRGDRHQVKAATVRGDWLGWPTGPHIKTVHLVNFLSKLTSSKTDEEVTYRVLSEATRHTFLKFCSSRAVFWTTTPTR